MNDIDALQNRLPAGWRAVAAEPNHERRRSGRFVANHVATGADQTASSADELLARIAVWSAQQPRVRKPTVVRAREAAAPGGGKRVVRVVEPVIEIDDGPVAA